MTIPMYLVSTFTTEFHRGNPAAVCLMQADEVHEDAWYGRVSALLAQPATAFCQPAEDGWLLRWFSPSEELVLCGHGTIASTHALYESGAVPAGDRIEFATLGGRIGARRDSDRCWISLEAVHLVETPAAAEVLNALRLGDVEWFGRAGDEVVVVLDSVEQVEQVRPDFDLLRQFPWTRTVVTAAGGDGADFTSRVFPPRIGIPEDQVTGSAHAALGPYWGTRLDKQRLVARQASARGGELALDLSIEGLVQIGGTVVTDLTGELLI
jgi:PhzF family phenazine biosynthesis protein